MVSPTRPLQFGDRHIVGVRAVTGDALPVRLRTTPQRARVEREAGIRLAQDTAA